MPGNGVQSNNTAEGRQRSAGPEGGPRCRIDLRAGSTSRHDFVCSRHLRVENHAQDSSAGSVRRSAVHLSQQLDEYRWRQHAKERRFEPDRMSGTRYEIIAIIEDQVKNPRLGSL